MTIKVLVVDDSAFMRKVISDILSSDHEIEVVGTARDGKDALEKIPLLSPNVITLDVEMPTMNGLECLKQIMQTKPLPVIMLSSLTREGADATMEALELGAIDFVSKPTNIFNLKKEDLITEIIEKVKIAKNTIIKKHTHHVTYQRKSIVAHSNKLKNIVAIGTSTGGPKALQQVIPLIPGDIPAAFIIVQHMPPGFTKSLADRLNDMSELTVKEAADGDIVTAGSAYIAPGGYHLLFEKKGPSNQLKIKLNQNSPVGGHRPSVNVMMSSLSKTRLKNIIGVIMTGMGADGCEGLKQLKGINNTPIIAQDEQSCIVHGMPKAAVQAGIVDKVAPLHSITKEIIKMVEVSK